MISVPAHPDRTEHPAPRVLLLAWAGLAAQTAGAAGAWGLGVLVVLVVTWWHRRVAATQVDASPALPEAPRPAATPARRRTDLSASTASSTPRRAPTPPLLKAHQDPLTGLGTPAYLNDTGAAWTDATRARGHALCVVRVGLEGFDTATERFGNDAARHALVQVGKRLLQMAREEDRVVRLEGSEFVLLISCPADEAHGFSRTLTTRVANELQRPLGYRTLSNLHIGCSVGAAVWPLHGDTLDAAIQHADESLAAARARALALRQPQAA